MNTGKSEENESQVLRPSPRVVALVHVALFVIDLLVILFVVPILGDKYKDFGHRLPTATQFGFDLSKWFKKFGFFSLPVWVFLFWADAKVYAYTSRRCGRARGLLWFAGIAVAFLLLLAYVMLGMWLPGHVRWHSDWWLRWLF